MVRQAGRLRGAHVSTGPASLNWNSSELESAAGRQQRHRDFKRHRARGWNNDPESPRKGSTMSPLFAGQHSGGCYVEIHC